MNSQQYATNPQNYSRNARYAQSRESASPLRVPKSLLIIPNNSLEHAN